LYDSLDQDLELPAAPAARGEEALGVLEDVVVRRGVRRVLAAHRSDDLALREARAVVHRHDADEVVRPLDDHGGEAAALADDGGHLADLRVLLAIDREKVDLVVRDDDELREVDGVRALAQDLALRAALAAALEEGDDVREVVGRYVRGERLHRLEREPVAREDVADGPLRDCDQGEAVHLVLDGHQPVQAAAQDGRLVAGFPAERDEPVLDRAAQAQTLLDDADAVVRDEPDAENDPQESEDARAPLGQAQKVGPLHGKHDFFLRSAGRFRGSPARYPAIRWYTRACRSGTRSPRHAKRP
jgi:hypothetical protein